MEFLFRFVYFVVVVGGGGGGGDGGSGGGSGVCVCHNTQKKTFRCLFLSSTSLKLPPYSLRQSLSSLLSFFPLPITTLFLCLVF